MHNNISFSFSFVRYCSRDQFKWRCMLCSINNFGCKKATKIFRRKCFLLFDFSLTQKVYTKRNANIINCVELVLMSRASTSIAFATRWTCCTTTISTNRQVCECVLSQPKLTDLPHAFQMCPWNISVEWQNGARHCEKPPKSLCIVKSNYCWSTQWNNCKLQTFSIIWLLNVLSQSWKFIYRHYIADH